MLGGALCSENGKKKDAGVYVGVEDEANEQPDAHDDGVNDIWKEMSFVLEYSKVHLLLFCKTYLFTYDAVSLSWLVVLMSNRIRT